MTSIPLNDIPLHSQMMRHFFLASLRDTEEDLHQGLELLNNVNVDVFDQDKQLFRELSVGRWMAPKCRVICDAIQKKTGMTMDDIRTHMVPGADQQWVESGH